MKTRGIVGVIGSVAVLLIALFEVTFPLDAGSGYETALADPVVEADYMRCYREKDLEMHRAVFDTIDNPDVQKEMISTNRERIATECRELFPEKMITVREPARFNIVDLKPRFWGKLTESVE